jgi:hypothetical protein
MPLVHARWSRPRFRAAPAPRDSLKFYTSQPPVGSALELTAERRDRSYFWIDRSFVSAYFVKTPQDHVQSVLLAEQLSTRRKKVPFVAP